ncbi:MAB_1171c family putative transporter [Kitasatospora sp. NPDC048540]|uniref:MAB_1171c family putative transporter n=1 Tax=unclassified Kitasatospora TaxID=2633591 RepID=UPI00053AE729|nr:MAB_1171c family putative transporter [Kitasatospora sp. MBT63]
MSELPFDLGYLTIGSLAWLVAALKFRAWRREPSRGLLVVALAVASPATSFLLASPLLYRAVDRLTGVGNLATLLVYLGIAGFSAAAVVLALIWMPPARRAGAVVWAAASPPTWRRARRRLAAFAVLGPLMAALFALGGPYRPETPLTFDTDFAATPATALFLSLYQGLFAFALIDIGRVCLGHAARLPAGSLRRGIRRIAHGSFTACGYVLCKLLAIGAACAGARDLDWLSTGLGPVFAAAGAVLITAGFAGPAGAAWLRRRRDYRALRPLWDLVYRADRRLALEAPASPRTERLALRDLEWRTARRGLEIRDGQLTLRPWVDPQAVAAAGRVAERAGLDEAQRAALVVAAALRSAVTALAAGAPPRPREEQPVLPGLDAEPAEERAHLVRVARLLDGRLTAEALAEGVDGVDDVAGVTG